MPFDPVEPLEKKRVQKGGSFLCTDQYCTLHGAQRFATVHRCIAKGMTPAMVSILKLENDDWRPETGKLSQKPHLD